MFPWFTVVFQCSRKKCGHPIFADVHVANNMSLNMVQNNDVMNRARKCVPIICSSVYLI